MKNIAVMDSINFSREHLHMLSSLGKVTFCENYSMSEKEKMAFLSDIVIVDWTDPSPFLLKMKSPSLIALLSTGYGWIENINKAYKKGIYVANVPQYGTDAVAEHLLGLLLGVSKRIFALLNQDKNDGKYGFELKNKTIGIIGLGSIGSRFAEIMNFFGANIVTYNRTKKNNPLAMDVSLVDLLKMSDVICVTSSFNNHSKALINESNYLFVKEGAIVIGSTWGIVTDKALINLVEHRSVIVAYDVALEGNQIRNNDLKNNFYSLMSKKKFFLPLTRHIAPKKLKLTD